MTHRAPHSDLRPPGPDRRLTPVHVLQYISLYLVNIAVIVLPRFATDALGRTLGRIFHALSPRHRKIAMINLDMVFGAQKSESEKRQITSLCFQHFGVATVETLRLQLLHSRNFLKNVTIENIGPLYKARERGRGLLLCSAHYGNWEVLALTLGFMNLPMSVLARPINNPLVNRFLNRIRTASGNQVIDKHRAVRRILTHLQENRIVGIVNDQDVHDRNRVFCEFFGHQASVTPVPATIAHKTGCAIVTGYAIPQGKGKYLLRFGDPIFADQKAPKEQEIQRITRELNRRLETVIQLKPSYWLWMHKRFKTTPDGLHPIYDQPRVPADSTPAKDEASHHDEAPS